MKKVIITGVSSGLGKSLAKEFFEAGFSVVGLCRSKPEDFIEFIQTDLTDVSSVRSTCELIKQEHSKFDCIIQCAGDGYGENIDELSWKKTEQIFRLNAIAPIVITSELFQLIKNNEADIVNIGATIGFKPYHNFSVYGSSKWALRGWIENLQLELKGTKSRVIGVHPGGVDTPGNDRRRDEIEQASGKSAGGIFMSPDDIAKFILTIFNLPKGMEVSEVIINRK